MKSLAGGWGAVWVAMMLACGAARAQMQGSCTMTDENGKTTTIPGCGMKEGQAPAPPAPGAASAAKSFPYPGDSAGAAPKANAATPGTSPSGGSAPAGNLPPNKAFPYPGDSQATDAATAAAGAKPGPPQGDGLRDAGSAGESSSSAPGDGTSSSSSSSSGAAVPGVPDDPDRSPLAEDDDAKTPRHRRRLPAVPKQTPTEREAEDLQVAEFYQTGGNYKAAYLRATDAVSISATDPDAHFALAEAARRLGKLDEAQQHYAECLKLDPVPKEKKAAEKALKEMAGK